MTEPSPSALLAGCRAIALEAGALILGYYAGETGSHLKADGSPVTLADNYWGEGATTLEWTVSSPPPFHTFEELPQVR